MNKSEKARTYFDQGMNCSQAVFAAFADELGLDQETAIKIASTFGGGISRTAETCGAATGALMALGLKHGTNTHTDPAIKAKVYALGQDFLQRFRAQNGALDCRDLLGARGISAVYVPVRHMLNLESVVSSEGTESIHQLVGGKELTGVSAF